MSDTPQPLMLEEPLTINDARKASQVLARQRRAVEVELERAVHTAADAEHDYRAARAKAHVTRSGVGTAAEREAYVDADTAKERRERDIATGMVKVFTERLRALEGERAQLRALMSMSERIFEGR